MFLKIVLLLTISALAVSGSVAGAMLEVETEVDVEGLTVNEAYPILSGVASQYGPGRMESTIWVRQQVGRTSRDLPTPLPEADIYFATIDCRDVGAWFEMRRVGVADLDVSYPWESAYATDCAGLADGGIGFMLFNRHISMSPHHAEPWLRQVHLGEYAPVYVAEVDYNTAVRWGVVGRGQQVELRRLSPPPIDMGAPLP